MTSSGANAVALPAATPTEAGAPGGAAALGYATPASPPVASLRRNFSWTLAGNVVYAACQWGLLVVLAKLISAEMVGQFVLGVAVASPVFLLANLQLGAIQATDAKRSTSLETFLRLRVLTTLAGAVFLAAIVAASGYPARTAAVVLVIGAAKAMDALTDIFHSFYQQRERMRHVSVSLIINGVASLVAAAAAVWVTRDVLWAATGFALGSAVALLAYNVPTAAAMWREGDGGGAGAASLWRSAFGGPWDIAVLGRLTWMAAPVGVAAALVSLNGQLPRYFIHAHFGDRPLAVFAAMAYVMVAGVTFLGSLNHAAMPRLARHYAERDFAGFKRVLGKLMWVACGAGVIGVAAAALAGRQILTVLYRPEYAEHHGVFVWIMAAAAVNYVASVLAFAATATRAFKRLTVPYLAGTLATLAGCWVLVPRYGLSGAAWAIGVSGVAGCVGAVWILSALRRQVRDVAGRVAGVNVAGHNVAEQAE